MDENQAELSAAPEEKVVSSTRVPEAVRPLQIILVGVGGYGQVWWDLNRSPLKVRVVAIVDTNPESLAAAGSALGVPMSERFQTLREAIGHVAADAVIDSTPPQFHLDHALASMDNGLHLFTAKPMAHTWDDARRMVDAAEAARLVLGVNEQFRFGSLPLAVSHAIQMGDIGAIESIELDFRESSAWEGWRAEMAHPLLLDAAVQHFDMVRAITGLEAESVFCRSWRRDRGCFTGHGSASALFSMTGGVPFSYRGTWEHSADAGDATGWWGDWRIQGTMGTLRAEGKRGLWVNGSPSAVVIRGLDVRQLSAVVLDQFLRAVREGQALPSNGADDLKTLAMSELCIRSSASGMPERAESLERTSPSDTSGSAGNVG